MMFMILFCYVQVKCRMPRDICLRLQFFLLANMLPLLICFPRECQQSIYPHGKTQ